MFFLSFIGGGLIAVKAQSIASGPTPGEIYFICDNSNGYNIYRSTDHGETATLINPENWNPYLYADKSPGCIYTVSSNEHLYFSDNFGYPGSWIQRPGNYDLEMFSGVHEGFIYSGLSKHSEDYGETWIDHQVNGLPEIYGLQSIAGDKNGDLMYVFINDQSGGYYLFGSYNNYNDCFLIDTINISETPIQELCLGANPGELYAYRIPMMTGD
nr:hypothetical protein [Bacteroidota bacterium]